MRMRNNQQAACWRTRTRAICTCTACTAHVVGGAWLARSTSDQRYDIVLSAAAYAAMTGKRGPLSQSWGVV